MTPSTGAVGSRVTVSLSSSSFPLDGDYVIQWSSTSSFDENKTVILKTGTAPRSSYSVSDSFTVPEAGKGRYYVQYLRLGRDDPVTFQFDLMPSMKVTPSSAPPGSTVSLSCRGFPVNETGSISLDGEIIGTSLTVNGVGSFSKEITLPNICAGGRVFEANFQKLYPEKVTAVLQVVPEISAQPDQPEVGDQVTITGHGFANNSSVSIEYSNNVITSSPTTDSSGNLTYKFSLPQSSGPDYSVVATDADNNSATLTLSVSNSTPQQTTPPPQETPTEPKTPAKSEEKNVKQLYKPYAISPNGGILGVIGASSVHFRWQSVTNSKNVTYTLQIADNTDFVDIKPGMQQSGLKQNIYTLNVQPGKYYWRVKAVDDNGNESEWSYAPSSFQVGIVSGDSLLIGIFFFLAFIMALVVIVLLIRALSRRARDYYD